MEKSLLILVHIDLCLSLECYSCSGTTGCNDPFNSFGSGVSTTGTISSNTYCIVSLFDLFNYFKEYLLL